MGRRDRRGFDSRSPRFVLLDRDGVINRHIPGGYVTCWEEFEFLPRAIEALRLLAESGYRALVISNQACVGKGQVSSRELDLMTHRFLLEVALCGGHIEHVYYCRHKPEDRCSCRKPNAGMLLRARMEYHFLPEETYFVGDSSSDVAAAAAAGCRSILIQRGAFLEAWDGEKKPTLMASSLYEAVAMILRPVPEQLVSLPIEAAGSRDNSIWWKERS
jgi:D-glycero-D-manno-heptose 1,7-bisphosphate phosphatase